MTTLNQKIAAVIEREARQSPSSANPFDNSRMFALSLEEVANAIRLEVVEPALVMAQAGRTRAHEALYREHLAALENLRLARVEIARLTR